MPVEPSSAGSESLMNKFAGFDMGFDTVLYPRPSPLLTAIPSGSFRARMKGNPVMRRLQLHGSMRSDYLSLFVSPIGTESP